jgi:hypothetical protein
MGVHDQKTLVINLGATSRSGLVNSAARRVGDPGLMLMSTEGGVNPWGWTMIYIP